MPLLIGGVWFTRRLRLISGAQETLLAKIWVPHAMNQWISSRPMRRIFILPLFALTQFSQLSAQSTWFVDQSGGGDFIAIQPAIDSPMVANGDSILVLPGIYFESINLSGKEIVLESTSGPDVTIVDAQFANTVITVASGERGYTTIRGFTIQNGKSKMGGGMYIAAGSTPLIDQCTIVNNIAEDIASGTANAMGGAIYCIDSSPDFSRLIIRENICDVSATNSGSNSHVYSYGGGMYFSNCQNLKISNTIFLNNESRCLNSARRTWAYCHGGAIWARNSTLELFNVLFVQNTVNAQGGDRGAVEIFGGVGLRDSQLQATYCTFHQNGTALGHYTQASSASLSHSIIWQDQYVPGSLDTAEFSCAPVTGIGCFYQDPLFSSGDDGEYYLSQVNAGQAANSPCVDTGDAQIAALQGTTRTDNILDGGVPDIGFHYRTSAQFDVDRDDDGLSNDNEINTFQTNPGAFDSDGDGLSDGLELGLVSGTPDTDLNVFLPDADPNTTTDPNSVDTDRGGLPDGLEDANFNGRLDTWETDPNAAADDQFAAYFSGILPGGRVHIEVWGATPFETIIPAYSLKGPGPSPTGLGIFVDLSRPITLMDPFLSDAQGRASVDRLPVPNSAPLGLPVWMQVVEVPLSNNLQPRASNPVLIPVGAN
jgi:hypothetical protein